MKYSDTLIFGNLPKKNSQGENLLGERVFLLSGNLQQNSEIFKPTYLNPEEKISASFFVPNRENQTQFFSFFCLDFHAVVRTIQTVPYELTIRTSKSVPKKKISKIVPKSLPQKSCMLY